MNWSASSAQVIPPIPTTGISTALQASQTMRTAIGRMPAPETPPVTLASSGLRRSMSMTMPVRVLISDTASAPPRCAACALAAMLSTFGESLTINGVRASALFETFVTSSTLSGRMPNAIPPHLTLGQEMLSSIISTSPSSRAQMPA